MRRCVRAKDPGEKRSSCGRARGKRSARLAVRQSKSRERATEAKSVNVRAWWHLAVAFKLRGPQLRTGGQGAQRAAHSTPGWAGRRAGAGGVPRGGRERRRTLPGAVGAVRALRLPTLQGVVKGEPQSDALGFREAGRRERTCASGVGSAGEQGTV